MRVPVAMVIGVVEEEHEVVPLVGAGEEQHEVVSVAGRRSSKPCCYSPPVAGARACRTTAGAYGDVAAISRVCGEGVHVDRRWGVRWLGDSDGMDTGIGRKRRRLGRGRHGVGAALLSLCRVQKVGSGGEKRWARKR
jgi:hypothetical protein